MNEFEYSSLREGCILAISSADLDRKIELTRAVYKRWMDRTLSIHRPTDPAPVMRPGRPEKPELVFPTRVKKRSIHTENGRIALLHAIAHIELNAIDLALDIVARFTHEKPPYSFFDGWMRVAFEEAKHFSLLANRLKTLGSFYGALPAHDGLWQAANDTRNDFHARLAIVPLILEARGLDVTPSLINQLLDAGDDESAQILKIIYEDEKGHVAVGAKWFRFYCAQNKEDPVKKFRQLVRDNFRGKVRPPFNDLARASAGLTPLFYRNLSPLSNSY